MCSENEPTALTYSTARSVFRAPWSLRRRRKLASALSLSMPYHGTHGYLHGRQPTAGASVSDRACTKHALPSPHKQAAANGAELILSGWPSGAAGPVGFARTTPLLAPQR